MTRRLTRISPWQAGKLFAILYFIIGLVIAIPFSLIALLAGPGAGTAGLGLGFAIAIPFLYAVAGLIFVPLACLVFNFAAKLVGGLEVDVTPGEA